MKLTITSKKENVLLSRTEFQADLTFTKTTPARKEVVAEIAKQLKAKSEMVIVEEIKTAFGNTTAKVVGRVYTSKEVMNKIETKRMLEKHVFKEEKVKEAVEEAKPEEKKEEAKPEEAPKEEKKEEPKKEEAKEE